MGQEGKKMSISMAIFTFINVWWVSLFFILPLGVSQEEKEQAHHYAAAPGKVNWKKKLVQTTLVAAGITALLAIVIQSGIVQVR